MDKEATKTTTVAMDFIKTLNEGSKFLTTNESKDVIGENMPTVADKQLSNDKYVNDNKLNDFFDNYQNYTRSLEELQKPKLMSSYPTTDVIQYNSFGYHHSFDAMVAEIREEEVVCNVAVYAETLSFEKRIFDRSLFGNFKVLRVNSPVLIKMHSKPGLLTIEVLDGTGRIETSLFSPDNDFSDIISTEDNRIVEGETDL